MKKIYLVLGLLFMSLTSCNDWLDVELDNKVDEDKLFSSYQGFQEALAGVYSEMSKNTLYGQALTMEYVDLLGQYYSYNSVSNTYEYWKDFDYRNSGVKSSISSLWTGLYRNIGQANCILEWTDKNAKVLTEEQRNQIRGEALGLRAYMHFDLYRLFSPDVKRSPKAQGIPYNKQFGVSLPPMYTTEEVVQLVINDLLEAEQCLAGDPIQDVVPYQIITVKDDGTQVVDAAAKDEADKYVARMNLYAVKAMLARAYEARGEYAKAVAKADEVINSRKFRLLDFSSIDQSETSVDLLFSDEHIFSLRNRQLSQYSRGLHKDNQTSGGATEMTKMPHADVSTMYESNNDDVRYAKWFDVSKFVKFMPDSANIHAQKMPMIKLSEMYLLKAECTYTKDPGTALNSINELRNHRIRNNMEWKSITWDYIMEEMRREYVGEGQMWYVYKRNNEVLPGNGSQGNVLPGDDIFVFPMPDAEIENGHRP